MLYGAYFVVCGLWFVGVIVLLFVVCCVLCLFGVCRLLFVVVDCVLQLFCVLLLVVR